MRKRPMSECPKGVVGDRPRVVGFRGKRAFQMLWADIWGGKWVTGESHSDMNRTPVCVEPDGWIPWPEDGDG